MLALVVGAFHLVAGILGLWLVVRLARSGISDSRLTFITFAVSTIMAAYVFAATPVSPHLRDIGKFIVFGDFQSAYWPAGRALLINGPMGLRQLLEGGIGGYVGVPITAYLFVPIALLSSYRAAALLFFALGVGAGVLSWRMICRLYDFDRLERSVALLAMAAFGPLLYSAREGNISHFLIPAILLGLYFIRIRKELAAGIVFGVIAVLKPPLLLVGLYFLLRGRWIAVLGGALVCAALAGLSIAIFGWNMHVVWYRDIVAPYAQNPLPAFNVQSIAAFVARFETGYRGYADWNPHTLSFAGSHIVRVASLAILALIGWAAFRAGRRPNQILIECELLMVIAAVCLVSPLSWSHYAVWLLPAFAFAFRQARNQEAPWRVPAMLVISYLLLAQIEFIAEHEAIGTPQVLANILVSDRMFGTLCLLGVLIWSHRSGQLSLSNRRTERVGGSPSSVPAAGQDVTLKTRGKLTGASI